MDYHTQEDLFKVIIDAMNDVEKNENVGSRKKQVVLQTVLAVIGKEAFERYEPLLELVIDGLCQIGNKDIQLAIKRGGKYLRRCC